MGAVLPFSWLLSREDNQYFARFGRYFLKTPPKNAISMAIK